MPFPFKLIKSRSQQYNVANKDLFVIPIELMTNESIECTLLATSIGQECLNNVCQKIGLHQSDYFGLLFKSKKNVDQWVDLTRPLKKQLDKYATEVRLYFRLQYFVSNFQFLTDEMARNHYYFAMKMLVIEGKIACSRDDAILLASFSLQAEFGDYTPERHTVEYLNNFALFPKAMLPTKMAKDVLIECAISAYKTLAGVPSMVAEIYYISEAQTREGYGQEGFPAKDLDTGQDVCLGVCIRGIFVINTDANTVELFKWLDIANLIHNKKVFTIERNVDSYRKNYATFDADYASCMWRTCVEQHQYFMKSLPGGGTNQSRMAPEEPAMILGGGGGSTSEYGHLVLANGSAPNVTLIPSSELYSLQAGGGTESKGTSSNFMANAGGGNDQQQQPHIDYGRMQRLYDTLSHQHQQHQPSGGPHQLSSRVNGNIETSAPVAAAAGGSGSGNVNQTSDSRNRSSTEPIDLHHITVNCGTPSGQNAVPSGSPTTAAAATATSSTTPIYENQFDMDEEQRKKMLPAYRHPPAYESFLKQKYSAMASLSQSLSSIPSRLVTGSHGAIHSASSSSSLVQPYGNNLAGGGHRNAMSTMSVPHLLQQQQQQQHFLKPHSHQALPPLPQQAQRAGPAFSGAAYKNYSDLSNLDIDKFGGGGNGGYLPNKAAYRGSLPPPRELPLGGGSPVPRPSDAHQLINQLRYQKAGMFTSSSPELNTLQLLQQQQQQQHLLQHQQLPSHQPRKNVQFKPREIVGSVKNYPSFFASVPDLTFKSSSVYSVNHSHSPDPGGLVGGNIGDYKKQAKSRLFGGRNLKIFQRHNNTGSEPNLSNNLGGGCYNLQPKLMPLLPPGSGPLTKEQRSNSMSVESAGGFGQHRHLYSIPNKIDEAPEPSEMDRRRSSADNIRTPINGSYVPMVDSSPTPLMTTTIASNYSDVKTVRTQPSHVIYVNVNPSHPTTTTSISSVTSKVGRPELICINKPQAPNPNLTTTNISINTNNQPSSSTGAATAAADSNGTSSEDATPEMAKSNGAIGNRNLSDSAYLSGASSATNSSGVLKSSRILVFGRSFEDQDFTREFELLPRMNPEAKFTTASLPENVMRNRFRDILPYEENRVKLTPTKENKNGYINASHVLMTFGSMTQHYIAAQGPLPSTTLDFWQMVYEQSIGLVVMVTNFTESGHQKCHTYLPLSNEPGKNSIRFGDFEIHCNFTSMSNTFITSHLTLTYQGHKPRTVTHLRYTDWTDHSSPADLQGFLSFLTEMDTIYRAHVRQVSGGSGTNFVRPGKSKSKLKHLSGGGDQTASKQPPILVHCSAGAGRSGVVILCDALLRCLDVNFSEPIDIPKALIQLRYQRMISVQHCVQFRFVCQVLAQYLSNSRLI